ncbi:histidine kinase N-terminal 7TM domain-containing protein [Collinsella aerofaciens]|uniref:histidine kinase N-terminal 7TM domain-containing protein n=1 Tax=Collinsella aerofaciens TaxID=74426 RepID=UPI0034A5966A
MPRFLVGITHLVYRRRAFVIAGVITALFLLLLAVLPALFASDPKLSNTVPVYSEVSKEVVDGLIHSSSIPLLVAAIAFSIWGVLVYLRCLDYVLRRRLVAVATICALWMIEVILKYKSFTPFYATILWYLYYVPMTLVPLLYQLCGLRLAGLEQHRAGRRYRTALWTAAILLMVFVLTNDFHQQVFHFDRSSDTWSNDYTYGWGYFAVLIWTAFNFVTFFILVGRSSSFRIQRFSGTAALVLLGGAFFAISYALRVPWAWKLNFSLVYCVLCVVTLEICLDCGVIPSYHDIAGIFDTLPLDLKVLTRDLQEVYATPVSKPIPAGVREELRAQELGHPHAFAVVSNPDVMYRSFPLLGGSALLAQDVSEVNELNRELAHRRMELQRQNELLTADYDLKAHLADQEAEALLVKDVDQALARALGEMYGLLSSLPPLTDEASSHERYRMLQCAKMFVAYCKRKGSLTLAQHGESGFDRDRIQLIANEMASDLRTIDVDCASIIAIRRPMHASAVSALYDCVYDFAFFAYTTDHPALMYHLSDHDSCSVELRATLFSNDEEDLSQTPAAHELESALQGRNVAYRLEGESGQLRMIVLMPWAGE